MELKPEIKQIWELTSSSTRTGQNIVQLFLIHNLNTIYNHYFKCFFLIPIIKLDRPNICAS